MALLRPPIMAKGTLAAFENALSDGIFKDLQQVLWGYVTSGDHENEMIFVDPRDKVIHLVKGNNEAEEAAIAELQAQFTQISGDLQILDEKVDGYGTALNSLQQLVTAQSEVIESHSQTLATHTSEINDLTDNLGQLSQDLEEEKVKISGLQTTVSAHTDAIAGNTAAISTTQQNLSNLSDTVSSLGSDVQSVTAEVDTVKSTYATKDELGEIVDEEGHPISVAEYVEEKMNMTFV